MNIKARLGSGTIIELTLQDASNFTVDELKNLISASSGEPLEGMRLVYKGKILHNGQEYLSAYNILDQEVIHVARPKVSSTTPISSPITAGIFIFK
jgi:hypothetical protein